MPSAVRAHVKRRRPPPRPPSASAGPLARRARGQARDLPRPRARVRRRQVRRRRVAAHLAQRGRGAGQHRARRRPSPPARGTRSPPCARAPARPPPPPAAPRAGPRARSPSQSTRPSAPTRAAWPRSRAARRARPGARHHQPHPGRGRGDRLERQRGVLVRLDRARVEHVRPVGHVALGRGGRGHPERHHPHARRVDAGQAHDVAGRLPGRHQHQRAPPAGAPGSARTPPAAPPAPPRRGTRARTPPGSGRSRSPRVRPGGTRDGCVAWNAPVAGRPAGGPLARAPRARGRACGGAATPASGRPRASNPAGAAWPARTSRRGRSAGAAPRRSPASIPRTAAPIPRAPCPLASGVASSSTGAGTRGSLLPVVSPSGAPGPRRRGRRPSPAAGDARPGVAAVAQPVRGSSRRSTPCGPRSRSSSSSQWSGVATGAPGMGRTA